MQTYHPASNVLRQEQRRSLHRALTASVLGQIKRRSAGDVLAEHWPSDDGVKLITRGAVSPTDRADFPTLTAVTVLPVVHRVRDAEIFKEHAGAGLL